MKRNEIFNQIIRREMPDLEQVRQNCHNKIVVEISTEHSGQRKRPIFRFKPAIIIIVSMLLLSMSVGAYYIIVRNEKIFKAIVVEIEITDDWQIITVEPLKGEQILSVMDDAKILKFHIGELDDIGVAVGDIITVEHSGMLLQSSPPQVHAISWSIFEKADK